MITENYKNRFKLLAGINENIQLVSNTSGRSDKNTLGYFVEEYLLNLNSIIMNSINNFLNSIKKPHINITETKISENTLIIKFDFNGKHFLMSSILSFNENANTSVSLSANGTTEKFNLSSKHTGNDVNRFVQEIVEKLSHNL